MLHELQRFYLKLNEPNQSCAFALRDIVLGFHPEMNEQYKYKLPFFYLDKKPFCYLWFDKKTTFPYLGFVRSDRFEHPSLVKGNRKKMKVFPINPNEDIPIESLMEVLELSLNQYKL